jgi:AraC family transcriptional regulator
MSRRYDPVSMGSPRFTTVEVGAFQITRARFPAGLVLPAHVHERACVATTMSGAWSSVLDRRARDCRTSTLLVEPAGERHSNHFESPADVLVIQPDTGRGELLQPCLPLVGAVHCFRDGGVGLLARRLSAELTARDRLAPLVIEGLALELIATAARGAQARLEPTASPAWVRRARERLRDAPADGVSIAAIAAEAGVHPVHLARMFRACYGTSPGSYARRVRLDRAAERLAATDVPLAEVATDAGFADQSHFTRAFRRHTGLPPGRYRRRMRG